MAKIIAACFLAFALPTAQAGEAPSFTLKKFNDAETVKLEAFAGQIVVLDFFAYWCGPCQKSAPEIEEKIQKHYESKGGNPNGMKVTVVSVNVEEEAAAQTTAFIKRHRPSLVLNDQQGKTLEAYGGQGLPFVVVLDGTKSAAGAPKFEIVYRKAGFEGAAALRKVIDAIGKKSASSPQP
ncbi:MAG: TlpA family protein disulfide reductase [Verrucomicrobiales bacterium]|nr:TlpA family protein disulfide reductase [Verrucomicrobiales bacterium]